jgi:hypothetical protein
MSFLKADCGAFEEVQQKYRSNPQANAIRSPKAASAL